MAQIAPLIVIVGETASGKSALGMELARKFDSEIICADSRTVYKGMDIGTAKPSKQERAEIPHHLLDLVEPNQKYNAARFQSDATNAIKDISKGGKLPIMVGGTGLYIDSVIFNYNFDKQTMGDLRPNTLLLGIKLDRQDLDKRIEKRIDSMIEQGFIDEVKQLGKRYGWNTEAMTGIGYRAFIDYVQGEISLEEAKQKFVRGDKLLAKKQRTWFKRNKSIHWVDNRGDALKITQQFLSTQSAK